MLWSMRAEVDVYSFGIVMWEIMHRKFPFEEIEDTFLLEAHICAGGRPAPAEHPDAPAAYVQVCSLLQHGLRPGGGAIS